MPLYERDDVATPYGKCKSCQKDTRSHVLEAAQYEEFIEEVVIERSEEYANKHWEETEDIVKMRKAREAVVVCHVCWLERRREIQKIFERDYEKWNKNPTSYISRIKVVGEICYAYKFNQELKKMQYLIRKLKEAVIQ